MSEDITVNPNIVKPIEGPGFWEKTGTFFKDCGEKIGSALAKVWAYIKTYAQAAWSFVKEKGKIAWDFTVQQSKNLGEFVKANKKEFAYGGAGVAGGVAVALLAKALCCKSKPAQS